MPTYITVRRVRGPAWNVSLPMRAQAQWAEHAAFMNGLVDDGFIVLGGPLADEQRVAHVVEAESEGEVRSAFARDPWSGSHLVLESIDLWTIRLDARNA